MMAILQFSAVVLGCIFIISAPASSHTNADSAPMNGTNDNREHEKLAANTRLDGHSIGICNTAGLEISTSHVQLINEFHVKFIRFIGFERPAKANEVIKRMF